MNPQVEPPREHLLEKPGLNEEELALNTELARTATAIVTIEFDSAEYVPTEPSPDNADAKVIQFPSQPTGIETLQSEEPPSADYFETSLEPIETNDSTDFDDPNHTAPAALPNRDNITPLPSRPAATPAAVYEQQASGQGSNEQRAA